MIIRHNHSNDPLRHSTTEVVDKELSSPSDCHVVQKKDADRQKEKKNLGNPLTLIQRETGTRTGNGSQ